MTRSNLDRILPFALALLPACFNPRAPIVVSADGGQDAGESSASSGLEPTSGATAGTSQETASSSMSADDGEDAGHTEDASSSLGDSSGSGGEGGPLCGNRTLDDDEACDDGNDVDGDGCNTDCVESGSLLWAFSVPSSPGVEEYARDVAIGSDGTVYFLWAIDGSSRVSSFSSDGALLGILESSSGDAWTACAALSDGDLALAVENPDDMGITLSRVASDGDEEWRTTIANSEGNPLEGCSAIEVRDDDQISFAGTSSTGSVVSGFGAGNLWSGTLSGEGLEEWTDVFVPSNSGRGRGHDIACQPGGTCAVIGEYSTDDGLELFLRLFAPGGTEIWTRTYQPAGGYFQGSGVAIDAEGGVFAGGREANVSDDLWLRKFDSDGEVEWTYVYDNPNNGDDYATGVAVAPDGSAVVVGGEERDDLGEGFRAVIQKVDADGNLLWSRAYGGMDEGLDEALAVEVDSEGRIFVVGRMQTMDDDGLADVWIRCYAP